MRHFLQRSLWLALVLVCLVGTWLAAFAYTVWRLHEDALASGLRTAVTHVRNFEEHLTQTLQVIDLTASSLAPTHSGQSDPDELGRRLLMALRPAPFLRSISLSDAEGRIVASSNPENLGAKIDFGGFFPQAKPDVDMLRIGMPWRGRDFSSALAADGGQPIGGSDPSFIPVLRRLSTAETPLWLVAALNPDYFANHGVQLLPPDEGRVQWLRYDDVMLLSSSADDPVGQRGSAGRIGTLLATRESGNFAQTLPDGAEVLTAYRASSRFPVLVAVHIDRARALAGWELESRRMASIVIPALFALCAAIALVWRRQRRIAMQQAELDKERQLASSVFDASTDSIIITTPAGDILSVNPAFENITGFSSAEVLGRNPRLLASGLQDREFYRRMWDALLGQGFWTGEVVNRRKDGSLFTAQVTINAVRDAAGSLQHFVGISADISARKRYEVELLKARDQAEAAAIAKTNFLATMSHEIRTPLNGVLGMTDVLLMGDLADDQREALQVIKSSGDILLTVLNDVLDYSKIEAQGVVLEAVSFDPAGVVNDIVGLFGSHAGGKNLQLLQSVETALPTTVIGDPTRLRQVLSNLVSNAIKFTHSGRIVLAAAPEIPEAARLADLESVVLRFDVRDTGIGIPAEKLDMIFDTFSQADNSIARKYGGTGLGLAISRRLAEAMGGSLAVSSAVGEGSCFTLRIRVHLDQGGHLRERRQRDLSFAGEERRGVGSPDALHILVAEDAPTNQLVLRGLLGKLGHQVRIASDGAEAVSAMIAGKFDLILMDMQMPVMGGLEATRAIREFEAANGGHIPIVALTANAMSSDRQACMQAGMDAFLSKPVRLAELATILESYCAVSGAQSVP